MARRLPFAPVGAQKGFHLSLESMQVLAVHRTFGIEVENRLILPDRFLFLSLPLIEQREERVPGNAVGVLFESLPAGHDGADVITLLAQVEGAVENPLHLHVVKDMHGSWFGFRRAVEFFGKRRRGARKVETRATVPTEMAIHRIAVSTFVTEHVEFLLCRSVDKGLNNAPRCPLTLEPKGFEGEGVFLPVMSITTPAPKFNIVRTFLYGRCIPCAERRRTE